MNNKKFFLRYLKGEWLLQNNLFLFKNREQRKNEKNVDLSNMYNSLYNVNEFSNTKNKIDNFISLLLLNSKKKSHEINKHSKNISISYNQRYFFYSKSLEKGLLEIVKINYKKKIIQYEYVYLVNHNLMININLIKSFKGRYLGAKISSYIRKKLKI